MFTRDEVTYRALSFGSGVIGGALAGAVAVRIWRALSGADEIPKPTAMDHRSREVIIAGAVQGAVFGLIKALVSRLTAKGYRQFTGTDLESLNGSRPSMLSRVPALRSRSHA